MRCSFFFFRNGALGLEKALKKREKKINALFPFIFCLLILKNKKHIFVF